MSTYNPWTPMSDHTDKKHIGKLIEELGECTAAAGRCLIQGIDSSEPKTGKPNKLWLEEEIADVLAQIALSVEHFGLDGHKIWARAEDKQRRCAEWHKMGVKE